MTQEQKTFKKLTSTLLVTAIFSVTVLWPYNSQSKLLDVVDVSREASITKTFKPTSSARVDVCSSLLNTLKHSPSTFPVAKNQRTAGKLAALGMILGARYALKPENQPSVSDATKQSDIIKHVIKGKPSKQSAQSIVAYRNCLKQTALRQNSMVN